MPCQDCTHMGTIVNPVLSATQLCVACSNGRRRQGEADAAEDADVRRFGVAQVVAFEVGAARARAASMARLDDALRLLP